MESMKVSTRAKFECAYVQELPTKKKELNAHQYTVEVTVESPERYRSYGRVISFEDLNRHLNSVLPHKKFLYSGDVGTKIADILEPEGVDTLFIPDVSAESLCSYIASNLQIALTVVDPLVQVTEVKLRETNDSFVTWSR